MSEQKEIKFPLVFDKCPNCHSTRTVTDEVKGEKQEGLKQALTMVETPVATPVEMTLALPVPWVIAAFDVCAECGTLYCIAARVEKRMPPGR